MRSIAFLLCLTLAAAAQPTPYSSQRPGGANSDPLEQPRDLTGRSVKTPRLRVIHDSRLPGSSGWLMEHDPWLAYQMGRDLGLREFSRQEGAFGDAGRLGGKVLDDQCTPIMSRDHINSCVACHNVPWRDMGAGITIQKNASTGRNTPHGFGGGMVEMIGQEIRRQLLEQADQNHNGWLELSEARGPALVHPIPGETLDYGHFDDLDGDGRPDLNRIVYVCYLDRQGRRIPWARKLTDPGVAGYNLEVQVFGHGQRDRIGHGGLSSTLRAVSSNAWDMHSGLQAYDPTASRESEAGLTQRSLAGCWQFFTGMTRDAGTRLSPSGVSLDDPDRDGIYQEISEGDLDLLEFSLLNHPAPAEKVDETFLLGKGHFKAVGCAECHRSRWDVPQDRRFFELQTHFRDGRLSASLHRLQGGPGHFSGIYSDFRRHDLGPEFHEVQYDGSRNRSFRTAPLWGVASTAPYGHDGASLSLEEVVLRHGGEAEKSRQAFERLSLKEQGELLHFLRGLALYSTETVPCDLDGDGQISEHFVVAGQDTGRECFNPEWLFRHPGQVEGLVQIEENGPPLISRALNNLRQAYQLDLPGLRDRDQDGFPDILQMQQWTIGRNR
ncbi:MAG: di-heme oxidoredictase family protein [Vulcanimicrobiota bacterium]